MMDCASARHEAEADDGWPVAMHAGVLLLDGDLQAAEEALAEALRREPRNAYAIRLRAVLRARRGNPIGAAWDIAYARRISPWIDILIGDAFGADLLR
jgi:Flp pilus assembly protein TadD